MTSSGQPRGAGPRYWPPLVFLLVLSSGGPLVAQVQPAPEDTVQIPIPPEEVVGDTIPDALRAAAVASQPPPQMPSLPSVGAAGWAAERWEWGAAELSQLPGLTLLEVLERIPGMVTFRAGGFGRPVGLTARGLGGARLRVLLDGYELDPLHGAAFALEAVALVDLHTVRVERSASEIRVELETFRLEEPEPFSVVELGTGIAQTRVLRALFSRGFGARSVATGAFDLASTGGIGIRERYAHSTGILRWSFVPAGDTGVQIEWRRTAIDREGPLYPLQTSRSDLVLRGRRQLGARLAVEALLGRSSESDEVEEVPALAASVQGALRGAYSSDRVAVGASLRVRRPDTPFPTRPTAEGEARVAIAPLPALRLELTSRLSRGPTGAAGSEIEMATSFSPTRPLSVFGSLTGGTRLVALADPRAGDAEGTLLRASASGWRTGVDLAPAAFSAGAALFGTAASPIAPFGLPFDHDIAAVHADAARGAEAYLRIPVPGPASALRLEGWYTLFADDPERPYTPRDYGRAALVFHDLYYGGELEPFLRLEAVRRGRALVPDAPGGLFAVRSAAHHQVNLALEIRILDVQAFLLWENLLTDRAANDLPGAPQVFPRIVYGANWRFRN